MTLHRHLLTFILVSFVLSASTGCMECGPGQFADSFSTEQRLIGGNSRRAVFLWTLDQQYWAGGCLAGGWMVPVRRELGVVDIATLTVTPLPISMDCSFASDGQLLAVQDFNTHSLRIHDLESGEFLQELPVAQDVGLTRAVAGRHLLLARRPDVPKGETDLPVLVDAFTGEMREIPEIKNTQQGRVALSPQYLAYFADPDRLIIVELSTWTETVITTVSLAKDPQLTIAGQKFVWIETRPDDRVIVQGVQSSTESVRVYDVSTRIVSTASSWTTPLGDGLAQCGEPGLLMSYRRVIGFDGRELLTLPENSLQNVMEFSFPRFSGHYLIYRTSAGWVFLDTRDNSTRTFDVFGYLE